MPSKIPLMFPKGQSEEARWVYAIGFTDGTVKIGMTKNVRSRMLAHRQEHGDLIRWVHLFPRSKHAKWIESGVCSALEKQGKRFGKKEVFHSIGKADFIGCVRDQFASVTKQFDDMEAIGRAHAIWTALYQKHMALCRAEYQARTKTQPATDTEQPEAA